MVDKPFNAQEEVYRQTVFAGSAPVCYHEKSTRHHSCVWLLARRIGSRGWQPCGHSMMCTLSSYKTELASKWEPCAAFIFSSVAGAGGNRQRADTRNDWSARRVTLTGSRSGKAARNWSGLPVAAKPVTGSFARRVSFNAISCPR